MPSKLKNSRNSPLPPDSLRERASEIARILKKEYARAECALTHANPFELLIATILSAQCTDERVNLVTPGLFAKYPTPAAMLRAEPGAIESLIRSTGFYNNKAKNIRGACEILVKEFGATVPKTMEELLRLPGVARKTANVVLGTGYGIPSGFVVDTHIHRLARRLGLTDHDDPVKIERDLCQLFKMQDWIFLGHAFIWHGRRVCVARAPRCKDCVIAELCPSRGLPADAWKRATAASRVSGRSGSRRRAPNRTAKPARGGESRSGARGSDSSRSRRRS